MGARAWGNCWKWNNRSLGAIGVATKAVRDWTNRNHKKHLESITRLTQAKGLIILGPSTRQTKDLLKLNRHQLWWVVGLLTGYCQLKGHLSKLGLTEDPVCERCLEEDKSATHNLCDCKAIAHVRFCHLGQFFMEQSDYYDTPIYKVLHFIRGVGLIKAEPSCIQLGSPASRNIVVPPLSLSLSLLSTPPPPPGILPQSRNWPLLLLGILLQCTITWLTSPSTSLLGRECVCKRSSL
jgi:hypothetical protein